MTFLVSPAERPIDLWAPLGRTSSVPEQLGVDFLCYSPVMGTVGVQRKEVSDLVASLADGRVAREVLQMKELDVGIWLIEGRPQWTVDGQLLSAHTTFTVESFRGVMFSLQSQGFWVMRTDSTTDTLETLRQLGVWLAKPKHLGLNGRPGPKPMLGGKPTDKDWQVHLAQSLPGIGYTRARDIVEFYDGLPFALREGVDLTEVPGLGPVTAKKIEGLLGT